jgi:hypothetical protein
MYFENAEDLSDFLNEAMDRHGEEVTCCECGMKMDSLTVAHYKQKECNHPGCEELHNAPLCDRCYWSGYYATHDEDGTPYSDYWKEEVWQDMKAYSGEGRFDEKNPARILEIIADAAETDPEYAKQLLKEAKSNGWLDEEAA